MNKQEGVSKWAHSLVCLIGKTKGDLEFRGKMEVDVLEVLLGH